MADLNPTHAAPAPDGAKPAPAPAAAPGAAPAPAAAGAPGERPRVGPREGMPIRRSDSSRCRTPGCVKYHDFFQWNGKYYCLECYEALRNASRAREVAPAAK